MIFCFLQMIWSQFGKLPSRNYNILNKKNGLLVKLSSCCPSPSFHLSWQPDKKHFQSWNLKGEKNKTENITIRSCVHVEVIQESATHFIYSMYFSCFYLPYNTWISPWVLLLGLWSHSKCLWWVRQELGGGREPNGARAIAIEGHVVYLGCRTQKGWGDPLLDQGWNPIHFPGSKFQWTQWDSVLNRHTG